MQKGANHTVPNSWTSRKVSMIHYQSLGFGHDQIALCSRAKISSACCQQLYSKTCQHSQINACPLHKTTKDSPYDTRRPSKTRMHCTAVRLKFRWAAAQPTEHWSYWSAGNIVTFQNFFKILVHFCQSFSEFWTADSSSTSTFTLRKCTQNIISFPCLFYWPT